MKSYRCPRCGVLVPENELYPDPGSGQPLHLAKRFYGAGPRARTVPTRTECVTCGPVSMTMPDKQRWGWKLSMPAAGTPGAEPAARRLAL